MLGEATTGRDHVVQHNDRLALREGRWKYIAPSPGLAMTKTTNSETANDPDPQRYDLASDPAETRNCAPAGPARVAALMKRLEAIQNHPSARETKTDEKRIR